MMKIEIEIPNYVYSHIQSGSEDRCDADIVMCAIRDGAPLPKEETNIERNLLKKLMSNRDKMHAFVRLESSMHNFIDVMGDVKLKIDISTKKERNK